MPWPRIYQPIRDEIKACGIFIVDFTAWVEQVYAPRVVPGGIPRGVTAEDFINDCYYGSGLLNLYKADASLDVAPLIGKGAIEVTRASHAHAGMQREVLGLSPDEARDLAASLQRAANAIDPT